MDLKEAHQKENSQYIARTTTPVKVLVDSVSSDELGALVGQTTVQRQEQSASAKARRQRSASTRRISSEDLYNENTPPKSCTSLRDDFLQENILIFKVFIKK